MQRTAPRSPMLGVTSVVIEGHAQRCPYDRDRAGWFATSAPENRRYPIDINLLAPYALALHRFDSATRINWQAKRFTSLKSLADEYRSEYLCRFESLPDRLRVSTRHVAQNIWRGFSIYGENPAYP